MTTFSGEQLAAIRARAPIVTVSAGAGSGKTSVLVERFIDLVQRDGVSPLEILAITFTEKAAAEMKERIVRRFEECDDVANRRLAEAAYISTIHGFCSRILREHPLAARLDPSFRVMDEVTRNVFLDEYLEELYKDDWYVETEPLITKRYESMRPRLVELIEEAAFLPDEFGTAVSTEAGRTLEEHVAAAVDRTRAYWDGQWAIAREQLLRKEQLIVGASVNGAKSRASHAVICALIAQVRIREERDAKWAAVFLEHTGFTRGVNDGSREEIKAVLEVVKPTLKASKDLDLAAVEQEERTIFAPIKVGIYTQAAELRRRCEEFKRQHGLIDFTDMQRRALELLDDESVRGSYARRFKHILLDEAQDTNDVQMRLIEKLRDGRQSLFAVGDVKQSIYGFRGALGVIPSEARNRSRPEREASPSTGRMAIPRLTARNDKSLARSVRLGREAVEQFLIPSNHAELLPRDPLLHRWIREYRLLHPRERIHLALERVDLRTQPCRPRALREQVIGTPLPALDREHDRADHHAPEQDPPKHRSARSGDSVDRAAREFRGIAKLLLDAQKLVVLRHAVGSRRTARLDLPRTGRHREVGDERVFGLSAAMRDHRQVTRRPRHVDRLERLRQRADLVHFDQNRVRDAVLDAARQPLGVRDEQVVAHELHAVA
jgi:hypothetical protein